MEEMLTHAPDWMVGEWKCNDVKAYPSGYYVDNKKQIFIKNWLGEILEIIATYEYVDSYDYSYYITGHLHKGNNYREYFLIKKKSANEFELNVFCGMSLDEIDSKEKYLYNRVKQ